MVSVRLLPPRIDANFPLAVFFSPPSTDEDPPCALFAAPPLTVEASPLRHAPHTVHDIADDGWQRAYSRIEGCFPSGTSRSDKYWCPVGRIDNVYGDRNLVCSCPRCDILVALAAARGNDSGSRAMRELNGTSSNRSCTALD